MRTRPTRTISSTAVLLLPLLAAPQLEACLWDSDTLEVERREMPGVLELVTGKFLRHSEAFYRWRVEDEERWIREGKNPEVEFHRKYYSEPTVSTPLSARLADWFTFGGKVTGDRAALVWVLMGILVLGVTWRRLRHRRGRRA